ncbi:MAG: hypothetical protein SYR96_28265 [Actinomycetota bacterium]|nr:hypothetical protein [Actinomycetota bacterium]
MTAMIVVSSVFIGLVLLGLWPVVRDWRDERVRNEAHRRSTQATAAPGTEPGTLEGGLVADLFTQRLNGSQYQRAMERLAAADDDRRPLRVPPEAGSGAGKP